MPKKDFFWVHSATYTFRMDAPEKLVETLWVHRAGWGWIKFRDMWIRKETSLAELSEKGFEPRKPQNSEHVHICPFCGLYASDIPGFLFQKHVTDCGGDSDNWLAMEDSIISGIRLERFQAAILQAKLREQMELEDQERRNRHERIRDEYFSRQQSKDRKKRLKDEARTSLRNR